MRTDREAVILCVDDEQNPLVLRKLMLQKAGYKVLTANSGQEALKIASEHVIDLILSDQLMPGMTGTELAAQVKGAYPRLPIIVISGLNDTPSEANLADRFLSKVEGPDALCREIAAILNCRNEHQEPGPGNS